MSLLFNPSDFYFGGAQPLDSLTTSGPDMASQIYSLPGTGTLPSVGSGSGLGFNIGTANLALSGLQTLGNLWGAFQSAKMAKKQFNFMKDITNTNLANQIQSYNTALADRARSRAFTEGQSPAQMQQYIDQNSLHRGHYA